VKTWGGANQSPRFRNSLFGGQGEKEMKGYVVFVLAGSDGEARVLDFGPIGQPLETIDRLRAAGISTPVTEWLDGLDAAGQKPTLTVLLSVGVSAVTATRVVKLLSARMTGLLRHDRPHRRGLRQACAVIFPDGTIQRFTSIRQMVQAAGLGRQAFDDRLGRADNLGIIRLTVEQDLSNRA
jgi:hypothetical protein